MIQFFFLNLPVFSYVRFKKKTLNEYLLRVLSFFINSGKLGFSSSSKEPDELELE